jgi:hypothetical protein
MKAAYDQIVRDRKGVSEVASMWNYKNYETFSRAFKKHFKLSPDDLKAITTKAEETSDLPVEVVLAPVKESSELFSQVLQLIKEKNISMEDLKEAQVYKVTTGKGPTGATTIKNKYTIQPDPVLKEFLDTLSKADHET